MSNLKSLFSILIALVNVVVSYFQDKRRANLLIPRLLGLSVVAFLTACGGGGGDDLPGDDPSGSVTLSPLSETTTTEAGGTVEVEVSLNVAPTHIVTVNLTSSDTSEGIVSPATLEFTPGNWDTPQSVTVMGVDDEDDDGDVSYAIEATVSSNDTNFDGFEVALS